MFSHHPATTIPAMASRRIPTRWAAWAFAFALLLKAALSMLATGSAHVQGKALVEVCTVYGVATVALNATDPQPAHDGAPSPAADHCVLTALAALAGTELEAAVSPTSRTQALPRCLASLATTVDSRASWLARLSHAPPYFA